jgi:hypothetical protein
MYMCLYNEGIVNMQMSNLQIYGGDSSFILFDMEEQKN